MSIASGSPVATLSRVEVDRADLEPYARSDLGRSFGSIATSVVPFFALWAAIML